MDRYTQISILPLLLKQLGNNKDNIIHMTKHFSLCYLCGVNFNLFIATPDLSVGVLIANGLCEHLSVGVLTANGLSEHLLHENKFRVTKLHHKPTREISLKSCKIKYLRKTFKCQTNSQIFSLHSSASNENCSSRLIAFPFLIC